MKFANRTLATKALTFLLLPAATLLAEGSPRTHTDPNAQKSSASHSSSSDAKHQGVRPIVKPKTIPRTELFVGFSYLRAMPGLSDPNRLVGLYGGSTSVAFNVSPYIGLVTDFGGFRDTELRLTGPGATPTRITNSGGNAYTLLFGPRISFRHSERFTPFLQVLGGGIYASSVSLRGCGIAPSCTVLPSQTSMAITAGGGLDLKATQHIALRLFQAEYLMTRFSDPTTLASMTQNDMRLSGGIVFRFGSLLPAAAVRSNRTPVSVCSVDHSVIDTGDAAQVMARVEAVDPDNDPLQYTWTATGGTIEGTGTQVRWNSATAPGSYTLSVRTEDGHGGASNCSAAVLVEKRNSAPVLSCQASPTTVQSGAMVQLTALASDPDNDALTYGWKPSAGRVSGTGSAVLFDTTGLAAGQYSVEGSVSDGHAGSTCLVNVEIAPMPIDPQLKARLTLRSIYFATAEPTEHDAADGLAASQKEVLRKLAEDFKTYLKAVPDATLTLEGHADPRSSDEYNLKLSERRVNAAKLFLIAHDVPESQIKTETFGSHQNLTPTQVKTAVERSPELTVQQRQAMLGQLQIVILASNRRVDLSLNDMGEQHSVREYPFNASDAVSLLAQSPLDHNHKGKRDNR